MEKIRKYTNPDKSISYIFSCPACKEEHEINNKWTFNDNYEKPTINPSVLVTWPANPNTTEKFKEWRTERRCHSFIREGKIEYLQDCTHHMKGMIVDLLDIN